MKKNLFLLCFLFCSSSFSFSQVALCPGTCADFNIVIPNIISWQWTFPGGTPSSSTDQNPTNICYNTPGNYDVTLITTDTNGSDTFLLNNYVTVYPYPPPQGIYQNGDTLFANQGAVTYQWYFFGNIIPGATDYFYVASVSGDYTVVATDANGCEVETASFWDPPGTNDFALENTISLFPNPANNEVAVSSWQYAIKAIEIFNTLGEKVLVQTTSNNLKPFQTTVDVRRLPASLYFVTITTEQGRAVQKLVKQ